METCELDNMIILLIPTDTIITEQSQQSVPEDKHWTDSPRGREASAAGLRPPAQPPVNSTASTALQHKPLHYHHHHHQFMLEAQNKTVRKYRKTVWTI